MLRILHTADWHLGQSFHGFDRDLEHGIFLDWLVGVVKERRTDALIIAGDIFDSVNPPAGAQRRFFDFLARAHAAAPALQVIVIAGNHDAGARLEAPAGLFESMNIKAVGTIARDAAGEVQYDKILVPLKDANGCVRAIVLAVPFLRPADVPAVPESSDSYLAGIREFYRRATKAAVFLRDSQHPGAILMALGHCHLADAVESRESERRIVIGGEESLRADTFPAELAHVALGHLHRPQEIEEGRICYSGSPIPLSFSEKDYEHRVVDVIFDESGQSSFQTLPVPKSAMLLRIPADGAAPLAEILQLISETVFDAGVPPGVHPFLEIRVLDDGPDPTRRRTIERALEGKPVHLASIRLETPQRTGGVSCVDEEFASTLADLASLDPEEIMRSAYVERYRSEPDPSLLSALREILSSEAPSQAGEM
jgi:DNA repair protein SbcD/Mre11